MNVVAFCGGAAIVWFAGTRLAAHADAIAEITGVGTALIGMLLLGGITSLPEIAVSVAASLSGSARLAANNILGGVALQVVVIALGDAALRTQSLSAANPAPSVAFQAIFSVVLLGVVAVGVLAGDVAIAGLGVWTTIIFAAAIAMLWGLSRHRGEAQERPAADRSGLNERRARLLHEFTMTAFLGAGIVAAGFVLARTSEALAEQTGLGESFVGAMFTSVATSLPEISTVLGAVWLRRYAMAFSDIFGTNMFDIALLFLIEAVYAGPPVLNEVGAFSAVAALLGIAVTLIYLAGLIWQPKRTLSGIGPDSIGVIAVYLIGVAILYTLR